MRRSGPPVAVVVGALVVGGTVAGCDAPPGTGEPSPQATAPPVWGALDVYLDDYLDALLQLDRAHAIAAGDEIAACMKEQGFDYTPDPQGAWVGTTAVSIDIGLDWVAEHGYGIADGASRGTVATTEDHPDPNAEAYAAMSDAERAAWDTALRGDGTPGSGCQGAVDPFAPLEDPQFRRWQEAQADITERADDEPEVVDARLAWVDCMADAGYPGFTTTSDGREAAAAVVDARDSGLSDAEDAELLADEIALATADLTCDESSAYADAVDSATERLQAAFVDEHRAELDAWRATWLVPTAGPQGD